MSLDLMIKKIIEKQNPTVVGLDPKLEMIPEHIKRKAFTDKGEDFFGAAAAILAFNCELIDAICDIVPAVKPQAAYYEAYGWQGMKALSETISYAKQKGLFVILDGKRNDIGSTMEAYGAAHLGKTVVQGRQLAAFDADALTVNGYLGTDGIKPLLDICQAEDKGIFVLVKTSNPSSGELQDLVLSGGKTVYRTVGHMTENWGTAVPGKYGYTGAGAVVGATYPQQLTELRKELPRTFFLIPGYGAQGGKAKDLTAAFDQNGLGGIVNSSRAVLGAWQKEGCAPESYAQAARRETIRMRDELMDMIGEIKRPAQAYDH